MGTFYPWLFGDQPGISLAASELERIITMRMLTSAICALSLAACGGGGGDSGSGTPAPSPESQRITAENAAILRTADTLLMSDIYTAFAPPASGIYTPSNQPVFDGITTRCSGETCIVSVPPTGQYGPVDLSELSTFDTYELTGYRGDLPIFYGRSSDTTATTRQSEHGFGSWLDHSGFAVPVVNASNDSGAGYAAFSALSYGNDSGSRPLGGTASWAGAMEGFKAVPGRSSSVGRDFQNVSGDARVTVDFFDATADVAFTGIVNRHTRRSEAPMYWTDLGINHTGRFAAPVDAFGKTTLIGTFYGPGHAEVGGVFERDDVVGAFGAARD